jgi:hypothetical protein
MNVVEFPKQNLADIPLTLRNLADRIEKGEVGTIENMVWILSAEDGALSVGLVGASPSPVETTYYLCAYAQKSLLE